MDPTYTDGEPFTPSSLTRITTENSVWMLRPDAAGTGGSYLRMPRNAAGRPETPSDWSRLRDGEWLPYTHATWSDIGLRPGEIRLNIKPVAGPTDGQGILTGAVDLVDTPQAL